MRGLAPAPTEIPDLEALTPQEVLTHAVDEFSPRLEQLYAQAFGQ